MTPADVPSPPTGNAASTPDPGTASRRTADAARTDVPPVDAARRHHVVTTLDRPLLVEAGAGTGKTRLLVTRLLHALETGAVQAPGIVAITFTEQAAAELRARLDAAVTRRRDDVAPGSPAAARLAQAHDELERARVSTIHAFAAALLREHPLEARLDPGFQVLDELGMVEAQRRFWNAWMARELEHAEAAAWLVPLVEAGIRIDADLAALALALHDQRDLADALRVPAPPADLEAAMRALHAAVHRCWRHAQAHCRDASDKGYRHVADLWRHVAVLDDLPPRAWAPVFLGKLNVRVRDGNQSAWDPGTAAENKDLRRQIKEQLAALQQALGAGLLRHALHGARRFVDAYAAHRRRAGLLDFEDLLLHARDLVRDAPAVRRRLAQRIDMLCVDEFQDTDPLQAELVMFLSETGGPAADWREVVVGARLFLVGDPKQSIYRFRRADLDVYQRCRERILASGGEVVDIVQNFRSRAPILAWVNGVFEHLFADAGPDVFVPRHVPLEPRPDTRTAPAVWYLEAPPAAAGERRSPEEWRRAEAQALADWIALALAEALPVRAGGRTRPVRAEDIAILFPRTTGIEAYEAALQHAGIPWQEEGGRRFFQRPEVRHLLQALRAIEDPLDAVAVVGTLRSPLVGATDRDLVVHHARHGHWDPWRAAPDSPLAGALHELVTLHARRHVHGAHGTLARLLAATRYREVLAATVADGAALAHVDTLLHLARRHDAARPGAGVRGFLRFVDRVAAEAPRLGTWGVEAASAPGVRLLTVHAAKGLEFPVVLLANLDSRPPAAAPPLVFDHLRHRLEARLTAPRFTGLVPTPGYRELWDLEKRRQAAEEERLLYVAATRARDHLVLPADPGEPRAGMFGALQAVPGALGAGACGALEAPVRTTTLRVDGAPAARGRFTPAAAPATRGPRAAQGSGAPEARETGGAGQASAQGLRADGVGALLQRRREWLAERERLRRRAGRSRYVEGELPVAAGVTGEGDTGEGDSGAVPGRSGEPASDLEVRPPGDTCVSPDTAHVSTPTRTIVMTALSARLGRQRFEPRWDAASRVPDAALVAGPAARILAAPLVQRAERSAWCRLGWPVIWRRGERVHRDRCDLVFREAGELVVALFVEASSPPREGDAAGAPPPDARGLERAWQRLEALTGALAAAGSAIREAGIFVLPAGQWLPRRTSADPGPGHPGRDATGPEDS